MARDRYCTRQDLYDHREKENEDKQKQNKQKQIKKNGAD